jgi:hypothetical protein
MTDSRETATHEKGYSANGFICGRIFDSVAVGYDIIKVEDPLKERPGK